MREQLQSLHDLVGRLAVRLEAACQRPESEAPPTFVPRRAPSPTGDMDREAWLGCAMHVLEGAFRHVEGPGAPFAFPRRSPRAYPWLGRCSSRRRRAEATFEALVRTFNLAAPLIQADPAVRIRGIGLADYYRAHLLSALTDSECRHWIGRPDTRRQRQPLVELGHLALWCLLVPDAWWDRLTSAEQDRVAEVMREWSAAPTCDNNWRWFNVMLLTFLAVQGRPADRELMRRHLSRILEMSVGDGWYADVGFDYYTAHVFQLFGAVWCRHYGRKHEPGFAARIDQSAADFACTAPMLFGRGGEVNMYGRSIAYRQAVTAGLVAPFLGDQAVALSPGEARRICSAAMLHFVGRADTFQDGIPSLGFRGPFEPAVQRYSCAASPYEMFLPFVALTLPPGHPFWSAPATDEAWRAIGPVGVRSAHLAGPRLLLSQHGPSGAAEIRGVSKPDMPASVCSQYDRQVYNTAFPWEADAAAGPVSAQLTLSGGGRPLRLEFLDYRDGVLRRRAVFGRGTCVDIASLVIPGGEIRIDRASTGRRGLELGHFSLPHLAADLPVPKALDLAGRKGLVLSSAGRSLGLLAFAGWEGLATVTRHRLHPEGDASTLPYLVCARPDKPLVSILLHRTGLPPLQASDFERILPLAIDWVSRQAGSP